MFNACLCRVQLIFFVIVLDSIEVEGVEWLILWVCFFGVLKVGTRAAAALL